MEVPASGLGGGHLSLAGGALSVGSQGPGGLGFAAFSTEGMDGRAPVSGAVLSWRPSDAPLGLNGGWLAERETLLGSRAAGAFGRLSADSAFVGVDGGFRAGAWRLDASAEFGMARAPSGTGMVTGLSPVDGLGSRPGSAAIDESARKITEKSPIRINKERTNHVRRPKFRVRHLP